jgi:NAD(P)-dependent dehydrogenase (short-subunit alcohol dehydrogenase family)
MSEFNGKTLLITGGTDGMGLVTAEMFAAQGAKVYISGRDAIKGKEACDQIAKKGGKIFFIPCDVSDPKQVEAMVEQIVRESGNLEIAFNNAGITSKSHSPLDAFPIDEWNSILQINLNGIFYSMKYHIKAMLQSGKSCSIINNSSVAGVVSMPMQAAYSASKAGVIALSKSAAIDYAQSGIRINVIAPGPVMGGMNTPERLQANPARTQKKFDLTAMHRFAEPEEIAKTVIWLSSSAASYITGTVIMVDGGFSAGKW